MTIAVGYAWFGKDVWAVEQSNRLLQFFHSKEIGKYGNLYTLDGQMLLNDHNSGLAAMNSVAALAADVEIKKGFY